MFAEQVLAALERDGVHDALALKTFQAGLDDFPFRGIHHERNLGNFGFAAEKLQKTRHRGDAINHSLVHADVDDVGAVLDLLARDGDGLVVFPLLNELRELGRPGDIRALANHHELPDLLGERLGAGEAERERGNRSRCARGEATEPFGAGVSRCEVARMPAFQRVRDGGDVLGRVAAAAAGDVDEPALGELAEETAHVFGLQVKARRRERIRQARVRIARDVGPGLHREFREERAHQVWSERAVQSDGQRLNVLHRVPQRLDRLRGNHRLAPAPDGGGDGDGQANLVGVEHFLDGHERGLGVEGIEDGLDEQEVRAARDERADLLDVSRLHLVERADAEAGVVRVRRIRERDRQRPDGSGDEARLAVGIRDAVGPLAALARGGLVDFPREVAEEFVVHDLLIKRRVFAPAVLARVLHKELALADARGGKGVRLDDVRAGFEEAPVNVANHLRLRERKQVAVIEQVLLRVGKALAAHVRLLHPVGADGRAHCAVNDGDALGEQAFQQFGVGGSAHKLFGQTSAQCGDWRGKLKTGGGSLPTDDTDNEDRKQAMLLPS